MGALLDLAIQVGDPSAGLRERAERANQAIRMLRELPGRHIAFVAGEPGDGPLPVTVVICTREGMVTGDASIPIDRWDPWRFLRFLQEQNERWSA